MALVSLWDMGSKNVFSCQSWCLKCLQRLNCDGLKTGSLDLKKAALVSLRFIKKGKENEMRTQDKNSQR